jgi:hypothetical protein
MSLGRFAACCVAILIGSGSAFAASPDDLDGAIERATGWLGGVHVDPFAGAALDLRLFTVEVEAWHRLAATESDPTRRSRFEDETLVRLRQAQDETRLEAILATPEGSTVFSELVVLAARCREHGIDPEPIRRVLQNHLGALTAEARRAPPSIGALYAAYLPKAGIESPLAAAEFRTRGMLSRRPAEVDLGLADVYYLTHEIFADCDYGLSQLRPTVTEERTYLLRVLPFYALLYAGLGNLDILGELLVCLHAAGMRDTYGYREGVRVLLERQNPDGSFGSPDARSLGRTVGPADYLHPTMNGLTALLLERRSVRSGAP